MKEFQLTGDHIPLISLLKALNWVESGGQAKMVVDDGLVLVNHEVEYRKRKKITRGDIITLGDEKVKII
jgi:ribosome-associated protein